MKKAVAVFLLFLSAVNLTGLYPVLTIYRQDLKIRASEYLSNHLQESQIKSFSFSSEQQDVRWEEPGKEFEFKGTMYDVIRCEKRGNITIYFCYDVRNETLVTQLIQRINDQQPVQKNQGVPALSLMKLLISEYESQNTGMVLNVEMNPLNRNNSFCIRLAGVIALIPSPPPEMI